MGKLESVDVVVVAFAAAAYLLAGARGLDMSRLARYVIASILIAIGLFALIAVTKTTIISDPVIYKESSSSR
jgi:hypothetical protein